MKKIALLVTLVLLSCGMLYAQTAEQDLIAANVLLRARDIPAAEAAFNKILKDYPEADINIIVSVKTKLAECKYRVDATRSDSKVLVENIVSEYANNTDVNKRYIFHAQFLLGCVLKYEGDYDAAYTAFLKARNDYAILNRDKLTMTLQLADCRKYQKNYNDAITLLEQGLNDYKIDNPSIPHIHMAYDRIGDYYSELQNLASANKAWMSAISETVASLGAGKDDGPIWKTFNKLSPINVTTEEYKTFLETTLRATPAVEENAKFLGRIKSELGKL